MADDPFLSREAIAAAQLGQLRRLLAALLPGNRFYAAKYSGVSPAVSSLEDFTRRFPFTTKKEITADQAGHPPHGTNRTFAPERYTRFHQTSGTTASPLRWLDTPESWDWMVASWSEILRAAGAAAGDRVFFAFSFGPFIGFWLAYEAAQRLGCLCIPGGGLGSAARLRMMRDNGATILCCTPTYALRLAEVANAEGIRPPPLKAIIVAGEPGGSVPAMRAQLEKEWPGSRIFDHHGMTETGPVTHECPERPGRLHVLEPAYFAEVVDPVSGQPAGKGQRGELVLTTLGRVGSPVLRYRTGDLVKAAAVSAEGGPCPCGRHTLALEGGILGRTDDMIVVRGVNLFPTAIDEVIRACGQVAEYQVTVSQAQALAEVQVRVEPESDCADARALVNRLERDLEEAFGLRVPVTAAPAGTLPRFEMKARRWVKA